VQRGQIDMLQFLAKQVIERLDERLEKRLEKRRLARMPPPGGTD
jgi:hypothetical protein